MPDNRYADVCQERGYFDDAAALSAEAAALRRRLADRDADSTA
jgi:hypothetical protein